MKIRVLPLFMLLCAALGWQPAARAATIGFSAGIEIHAAADFYTPLEPYGTWVSVGSYGRCFHPTQVAVDWRPYSYGHWEYTDVGWYWVSDEPFGWACFHYGSWIDDPTYGWIWVPGVEWSPAWVVWRESDDYIGWAPCGPSLTVAAPSLFVFVSAGHFCDPIRPNTVIVNNTTIINNTRVVNNFRTETRSFDGTQQRMRVNAGPNLQRVQRATGRQLSPTPIRTAVERTPAPQNMRRSTEPTRERTAPARERTAPAPERPAVKEPSGATRERVAPRETAPATRREAPVPQRPAVREPSGATREAPAPSQREEHRNVVPPQAPQRSEHAPVAPAHEQPHAAPTAPAPHGPPAEHERGNERGRGHDQP